MIYLGQGCLGALVLYDQATLRGTLVPIVDFTAKNSQSLVIPILLVKITNHHVFLHLIAIYIILKGYR